MTDEATQAFLQEVFSQVSEPLQADTLRLQDLWEQKLWHELTEALIAIFNHPDSGPFRLSIYNQFILQFADKINQLKLVDLALKAATQCSGKLPTIPCPPSATTTLTNRHPQTSKNACASSSPSHKKSTPNKKRRRTATPTRRRTPTRGMPTSTPPSPSPT